MKFVPFFSKNPVTCIHGAAAWRGDLSAQGSVRVEGGFEGHMRISGELRVASEGKVSGSVQAASLEIEQGAQFSGAVAIGTDPQMTLPRKKRP